jgi:hypothetical protein
MRILAPLAIAAAALGFAAGSQPAAAFDDSYPRYYPRYYAGYGSSVYIHHHVYLPPRYRHVYHFHRPGPVHVHVVHGGGAPWGWRYSYGPRIRLGGYFAPRYTYRRAHWMK